MIWTASTKCLGSLKPRGWAAAESSQLLLSRQRDFQGFFSTRSIRLDFTRQLAGQRLWVFLIFYTKNLQPFKNFKKVKSWWFQWNVFQLPWNKYFISSFVTMLSVFLVLNFFLSVFACLKLVNAYFVGTSQNIICSWTWMLQRYINKRWNLFVTEKVLLP